MPKFLLDRVQLDLNLDSILAEEFTFDVGSLLDFIENVENEKKWRPEVAGSHSSLFC